MLSGVYLPAFNKKKIIKDTERQRKRLQQKGKFIFSIAENINDINSKIKQYKKSYTIVKKSNTSESDTSVLYLIYFNFMIYEHINNLIINKRFKCQVFS